MQYERTPSTRGKFGGGAGMKPELARLTLARKIAATILPFGSIGFLRDAGGRVTGLSLGDSRLWDLRFRRVGRVPGV